MAEFQGKRVAHQFTQINVATPAEVFPLLCPVRERDWVPGWKYRMVYSQSGVAENGCIFSTPNEDGSETTWIVTEHDPARHRVAFVWVHPGMVASRIEIQLAAHAAGETRADIRYTYTGLSPQGNKEVERFDVKWFEGKMKNWEAAINHFLRTGKIIEAQTWE